MSSLVFFVFSYTILFLHWHCSIRVLWIRLIIICFCWYIAFIIQVEVLQVIYKEYTFDEFVDFSNSTFEMNWKVNNLLSEIQNVSGKVKVSWKFHSIWLDVRY